MLKNIRTRLFLTYLVLILFSITLMGVLFYFITREHLLKNREDALNQSAEVFIMYITPFIEMEESSEDALIPAVRIFIRQSWEQIDYRLQVVDKSNAIVMDSQGPLTSGSKGDVHFKRALMGKAELWTEESPEGKMMYKCVPVRINGQIIGAARLSISLGEIDELFSVMKKYFFLTFFLSLLAAAGASLFFIRTLMHPVTRVRDIAAKIAQGDLDSRVDYESRDELGDLSRTINFMADELKKLEQARAAFLGNVSHELRTPLTIIKGFVITLLSSDNIPEEWGRSLTLINRETDRLTRLVDELLELTRLRSGRVKLQFSWCDVEDILRTIATQMAQKMEQKEVSLIFCCSSPLPRIWADSDRVREICINLIDNALKYGASGGKIEVSACKAGEALEVAFRDNGPGIPENELPYVFERFFRGDSKGVPGTGIGLAIVKKIVEAHKGTIIVESKVGEGTVFKVRLPIGSDQPKYRTQIFAE